MDDLAQWLRAQFDEDVRIARAACWDEHSDVWTASPPRASYERYTVVDYCDDGVVVVTPENADADGVGQHVAEWDPARVLRETDAKRRLLDDHPIVPRDVEPTVINGEEIGGPYYPFGCGNCHTEPDSPEVNGFGYCLTWRGLASVYADRDGYRDEWAPTR